MSYEAPVYRAVTGEERERILAAFPPVNIPPEGKIVTFEGRRYLYFRNTWGVTYVTDVTGNVPAQVEREYPAPPGFLDEVMERLKKAGEISLDIGSYIITGAVIIGIFLLWKPWEKK